MNAWLEWRGKRGWLVPALIALMALGLLWERTQGSPRVRIVDFGPTPVTHGQPFNVQPNGVSAMWVRIDKTADSDDVLVLGGVPLETTRAGHVLTAFVPLSVFATPGPKPLLVQSDGTHRARSSAVSFIVK